MGGGVDVSIHADVLKADLPADDGAAAVVAQHVEAAAGAHTHNGGLVCGEVGQGLDAGVKAGHQLVHLVFQTKHGGDGSGVLADALHHAQLAVGGEVDHGGDLAQGVVGLGQAAADEDHIGLGGHDRLQIGGFDGAQIGHVLIGHIALEVVQGGVGGADNAAPGHAQGIQNIQGGHVQNGDALRIVGDLQLHGLLVGVQGGDGDGFGGGGSLGAGRRALHGGGGAAGGPGVVSTGGAGGQAQCEGQGECKRDSLVDGQGATLDLHDFKVHLIDLRQRFLGHRRWGRSWR